MEKAPKDTCDNVIEGYANVLTITIDNGVLDRYADHYFEQHPRARKKPIPHPYHESINKWMIMKRVQMNALKQKWKEFIIWLANDAGCADKMIEHCVIRQTAFYPTKSRHDTDNSVPKFILDGLVEGHVIIDDDIKCVEELRLRCGIDKYNPRTIIEIFY